VSKKPDDAAPPGPSRFEQELSTDLKDTTPDRPRGMLLHTRILIGLAVGVAAGLTANAVWGSGHPGVEWLVANVTEPVGTLFLRGLLMIVIPLIGSSLIVGVAGIGDIRRLGRVGLRSFGYCLVVSAISVIIGLTLANTIRPGQHIKPETAARLEQRYGNAASRQMEALAKEKEGPRDSPLMQVVKSIVPSNPVQAVSGEFPNMLQLMFFALVVGIAVTLLPAEVAAPLIRVLEAVYAVSAKIVDIMMKFAPYAVACLLFNNTARFGLDLLAALSWFVVTVLFLAQLAQVSLSLPQQLMVVYLAILGGIGTAGVPSGSIPFIIAVLATVHVNPGLIAIVLGVDRILDMCRTTLNVVGDLTAATYVARAEGYELLKPRAPAGHPALAED